MSDTVHGGDPGRAATGQFVGRKLRTDQVAGGHFNASAKNSPPAERVGPMQPARTPRRQHALSGLGEVERLRERAREARERTMRESGRSSQPTNGPPRQTERARLATSASASGLLAPTMDLLAVGSDGRFYHHAKVPRMAALL
mmetsp:Transcript_7233/g.18839  ORF Transcript_7233/g.18839 Transcript_7233/m.18839 type:complete len:143 (-) Transcript_7233:41-469(-)